MEFLSLPVVMIEHIISYLSYDEIARYRLVSKAFNEVCMRMLNRGFVMIERRHSIALKSVKAQLPRRESERRTHPLARHCDILTSIETRISMLNMTYSKFIDNGLCCFIPGKVIDEIQRILTLVESSPSPPRAHEVLQELRDISSMAIEHFDDKVSPAFRKQMQMRSMRACAARPQQSVQTLLVAPYGMQEELTYLRRKSNVNTRLSICLAYQYKGFYKRMLNYRKLMWRQKNLIKTLIGRQKRQEASIADLKKRIEECDIKYNELTHTNQAAGGKTISESSGTGEVSTAPQQPLRHFSSQIKLDLSVIPIGTSKRTRGTQLPNMKPRKPMIKLPSLSEDDPEPPPKMPRRNTGGTSPTPSTSQDGTTAQTELEKLREEIRDIKNFSKQFERKMKRPLALNVEGDLLKKKKKID